MMAVPQGWEVVPLESCAEITNSNVDKKTVDGETIVKLCNYMDVYSNTRIDRSINFMLASATDLEIEKFTLRKDDVIITKDSESPDDIGIPAYVSENLSDVICGYHLTLIRPNEICNGKFLSIALSSDRYKKYYGKLASGSTRYALSMGALNNTPILLPPLSEQQKIAEILSGIDRAIETTQTLIYKEKMIKKGLMADLLNHGIDEEGRIRSPQTHRYIESPLGMIPEGWEVVDMEELVNITTGNRDTQDSFAHGIYPFIVRSQTIERINSYAYDGEAILTAGDGVGVGKVFHFMNGKFDFHQRVYCLSKFHEKIDSKFLFEYFKTNFIKRVNKYSAKGSVDSVRYDMIAKMPVPIPLKLEQQKIAQILSAQDLKIETEEVNLAKLQHLKKGLMGDLLSGKVRVKV